MRVLPLILLVALALAARIVPGARTIDDAYITFRYARNLAAGQGPVFNAGQRVLGTTTPLYMGLLSLVSLPFGAERAPYPEIASAVNAAADGATCVLLVFVGAVLGFPGAGWAAALAWAVSPMSVTFAVGGLETSVYILLLVGIFYFRLQGRLLWLGVASGLALLARPDALLFLGLIWVDLTLSAGFRSGRRAAFRAAVLPAIPLLILTLPWFLFAAGYYGSPLPHSMFAKVLAYHLNRGDGLIRLLQHYGTPFFEHLTLGTGILMLTIPLYMFLSALAISAARRRPGAWTGLAFPWLYLLVFALVNPLIFRWYLATPLPFYFLSIFLGLGTLLRPVNPPAPVGRLRRFFFAGIALLLAGLSLREWSLSPDHGPNAPAPNMAWIRLELLYRRVAEDLQPHLQAGSRIAAGDVGVLGYFTGAGILDTVGLNSAEAAKYYPLPDSLYAGNYAIPPDLILDERPDYLVMLEVYGRKGLLESDRFLAEYRLCMDYPTDIYGSRSLMVFCRLDQP
jgi:arabinofuranosyltransferase